MCRNDFILYRKDCENLKECPRCGESRYKQNDNGDEDDDDITRKVVHSKVMWYLLVIQRFKRLFAYVNDVNNTRWHANERVCDGKNSHL